MIATAHRAALWTLLAAKLVGGWGLTWDIRWHVTVGRDSFWIPPHLMIYASVALGVLVAFGILARDTHRARRGPPAPPGAIPMLGLVGTRGFHLTAWGLALVVIAAPIDDLWHRLFGLDVTLWSPPHLLGLFGSVVSSAGCLLVAVEVHRPGAARLAALLLGGALLYAGVRVTLDPAFLIAYARGGLAFHLFAILGALALPATLLATARLAERRWAPVGAAAIAVAVGVAGAQIARLGFAVLQPMSYLAEEIARDPGSAIAVANEIARRNREAADPWFLGLALPLVAAAVFAGVDGLRRPVTAGAAYGVALLGGYGWYLASRPAFAPLTPTALETSAALVLAALAGAVGGVMARTLASGLQPGAPSPGHGAPVDARAQPRRASANIAR